MACTDVPHIVLHVSCWTYTSGGYFWPSEVRFRGILALSRDWFYNGQKPKMQISQNPFMDGFWSLGIQFYIHFCARKSNNLHNRVDAASVIVAASGHVRNLPTLHFVQIVQLGVLGHQELSAKTSCQHDTSFNNLNRTMKLAASVEGETHKGPNFVPSSSFLGINSVVLPVVLQCFTL